MCEALDAYISTLLNAMNVLLGWGELSEGHSLIKFWFCSSALDSLDSVVRIQSKLQYLSLDVVRSCANWNLTIP